MKYKIILASIILLQSQFNWSLKPEIHADECVSKSELVEYVKNYIAKTSCEFDEAKDESFVDRAARTRLGISFQHRLNKIDQSEFNAWLKFQESCDLGVDADASTVDEAAQSQAG